MKPPPSLAGVSDFWQPVRTYGADEAAEDGTSIDIAGSSDDRIEERTDEASEAIELITDSAEEAGASDETGAADEDGAAEDDGVDTSLEVATGVTGAGAGRLKIKMRPTITTTATMMIIQVLRFIYLLAFVGGDEAGKFSFG